MIWHVLLTVCLDYTCITQDVAHVQSKEECHAIVRRLVAIPPDGDWDSVTYQCKPLGSEST
jgi:hypothetical protein